jgi:hypothetical protein
VGVVKLVDLDVCEQAVRTWRVVRVVRIPEALVEVLIPDILRARGSRI